MGLTLPQEGYGFKPANRLGLFSVEFALEFSVFLWVFQVDWRLATRA